MRTPRAAETLGATAVGWLCALASPLDCATEALPACWCHPQAYEECPRHDTVARCGWAPTDWESCWPDALLYWWQEGGAGWRSHDALHSLAVWIGTGGAHRKRQDIDEEAERSWLEGLWSDPDGDKERWGRQALNDCRRRGLTPDEACALAGFDPIPF